MVSISLWLLLKTAQSADGGAPQRQLISGWDNLGDVLLQAGVEQFVMPQLGRITGKTEDGDRLIIVREPFLGRLRVVHVQGIEDQDNSRLASTDQTLHKIDQDLYVQIPSGKNLRANLPLVAHCQNRAQPGVVGAGHHQPPLTLERTAPTEYIVTEE